MDLQLYVFKSFSCDVEYSCTYWIISLGLFGLFWTTCMYIYLSMADFSGDVTKQTNNYLIRPERYINVIYHNNLTDYTEDKVPKTL